MKSFNELKDRHKGRTAIIMGAAPSLFTELESIVPYIDNPVMISINNRPARWFRSDYIVFIDVNTAPLVEGLQGERISQFDEFSDYHVEDHVWVKTISASLALYLADYSGCDEVILVGFDMYSGEREYFNNKKDVPFISVAHLHPLEWHLEFWRRAFDKCPRPEIIKAVGGVLVDIFGRPNFLDK